MQQTNQVNPTNPPSGFAVIEQILELLVEFETVSNLSIMSGVGDGVNDNTVLRTGHGDFDFAIPGSSLKGITRSTLEALLAKHQKVCAPAACAPKGGQIPGRLKDCGEVLRDTDRANRSAPQGVPCAICRMFGNTWQKGRVVFHDAPIIDAQDAAPIQRTHVAIDREKGTASPRALTTIETLPRGLKFKGSIGFTNPDPWMVGAVMYVLDQVIPQVGLGAKTTAGYGHVAVRPGEIRPVYPPSIALDKDWLQAWWDYLGIKPGQE